MTWPPNAPAHAATMPPPGQPELSRLLAASPDGVAVVDRDGVVLFANDAAERMLRPPGAPLVGGEFGRPLAAADGAAFDVPATGRSVEIRVTSLDWHGVPAFLVSLRDVTERRRAALGVEESEKRFRLAAEAMLDGVFIGSAVRDDTGTIIDFRCDYLNGVACRILGVEREHLLGRRVSEIYPAFPSSPIFAAEVEVVESGRPHTLQDARYEGEWAGHGYMSRSFDGSAVPSGDGLVAVFRDVTLREHSAEELERRVEERTTELTAANAELATFSYSVSHDLRAPLRAIEGFSHIVLRDHAESLDPAGRHALDRVIAGVARMNELIDALLGLSRVSSHPIKPETVELSDLTAEVADELRQGAPDHPVALVVEPALTAYGDPHLLRVLMTNLLGNAWKFTVGRPAPRIEVGRESTDLGESVFFVRDNGAGFDMAHADRLFRPFERLHRQGEFTGTGVGLATVQRIVRRHGGRVWARAAVGEGATFFFTLGPPSRRGT